MTDVALDPQKRQLALITLAITAVCLAAGLLLPIMSFETFLSEKEQSIVSATVGLIKNQEWFLGLAIGLFSIALPIAKVGILSYAILRNQGMTVLSWLARIGKWSMLDVFVVVATLGMVQLGALGETQPRIGIYFFLAAVVLTTIVALPYVEHKMHSARHRALPILGLVLLIVGCIAPLMKVDKWLFWEQQFSLLSAMQTLLAQGHWLLPSTLIITVILIPMVHLLGLLWHSDPVWQDHLAKWNMLDVFVIGILLVWFKLSDQANVAPLLGFWCLLAAAVVSAIAGYQRVAKDEGP